MKILLDTCVWGGCCKILQESGHDVVWAGSWAEDPGDEEILKRAQDEKRILVTLDKDFGELAIAQGKQHATVPDARHYAQLENPRDYYQEIEIL